MSRSSTSVDEAIDTLRRNAPGRVPISGYKHGENVVCTYFDHADNRWHFEHWCRGRLVDQHVSAKVDGFDHLFVTGVRRIIDNIRVTRAPFVNRDHVPPGGLPGVRVYDPAKRRTRSILTV